MKNLKVVEESSPASLSPTGDLNEALNNKLAIDSASQLEVDVLQSVFKTDIKQGISVHEAEARRRLVGDNEIKDDDAETLLSKFLEKFKEPMILLLLGSAFVSVLVKSYDDAASITLAVIIVCTVAFIQEYRSDKALDSLKSLTQHKANVYREGVLSHVDAVELVPGDLVQFGIGDRIPADIRLVETSRLGLDESILTGETHPASKSSQALSLLSSPSPVDVDQDRFPNAVHVHQLKNIAFMGTLVTNGNAKGIVVNTGSETELGKIAELLKKMQDKKTPLQDAMETLSEQISKFSLGIVAVIFLIGVVTGKPWLEMFTMGISLAVAAIPEGLPIVVTVTLAMGVIRMAKKNAIVRRLPSVEALGACDVICVDKTGTLTRNEMTCVRAYSLADEDHLLEIKGIGYQTKDGGFCTYSREYGVKAAVQDNLKNPIRNEELRPRHPHYHTLFTIGASCNNASLAADGHLMGQPTEGALLCAAIKACIDPHHVRQQYKRIEEVPFSHEDKWMAVKCMDVVSNKPIHHIKGALEVILPKCDKYLDKHQQQVPITNGQLNTVHQVARSFAKGALRVLAVAMSDRLDDDRFTLVGLVGLMDPPRQGVKEAISTLRHGGVKVIMITGDSKHTAVSVAKQLNLIDPNDDDSDDRDDQLAISVDDLKNVNTFDSKVDRAVVYYRMAPVHKMKIIEAYQRRNHVVAMTGDGVNDAPALKLADIGIAMGLAGTDVSKEASQMILADDHFPTILGAIEEGKSIFNNIKSFLRYQLTTSVSCMVIIIICTFFGLPLPLNPMQILWINIIMDGPPAQSLGVEPVDQDVMDMPPRDTKKSIISKQMIVSVLVSAFIMVVGTLYVFMREMNADGVVTSRDTTMTFTTFVMFQIFNAFNCRSEKKSVFQIGLFRNTAFNWCVGGCVAGQLLLIYTGAMNFIFETERISVNDVAFITLVTSSVWIVDEIVKFFMRRR
ncbi:golgi membrane-typec calcium-transporting ATPase [Acrasis kona]|uniref:Golgi membrane-typec calcium-transporting ATPase n=1 Tax=Acrasis kona TaxID=1008807 RepID=A0AAW2YPJ8_9EUKA